MLIYFDKDKRSYDEATVKLEKIEVVASIDYTTWLRLGNTNNWDIINGEFVDLTKTEEYQDEQFNKYVEEVYQKIVSKYDDTINYGVFQINEDYYGNMAWYNTWSKAVSLYENSGQILSDSFVVRLYKKVDGVYYNYDTTQTLASFKAMLYALNSKQFLLYQPIRNNLFSQLKIHQANKDLEGIASVESMIDSSFGDVINETITRIENGV
jgi:hypothetical protein